MAPSFHDAAIDLDDQLRIEADKVEDVSIQRHLPLELQPFELLVAQRLPEQVLALVASARMARAKVRWRGAAR